MTGPAVGSLFSGYGGLDLAVETFYGARTAWHAETDAAMSTVLAHRWPGVPNLGDVTSVDWSAVEPVDILTGGSPCQDVSAAGKRAGMRAGTRSGLWASMVDAIDVLRPGVVVWENVRGVLSAEADSALEPCPGCVGDRDDGAVLRALGRVLGDLAELGYDCRVCGLRAADVGAPHGRFRIFVIARDAAMLGRDTARPAESRGDRQREGATGRSGSATTDTRGVGLDRYPGVERGRGRPAQWRQEGDHLGDARGLAAADSSGHGWDEGGTEPAGIIRRLDAALGGATAAHADDTRSHGEYDCPGCGDSLGEHHRPGDTCPAADSDDAGSQGCEPARRRHLPTRGATADTDRDTVREQPVGEPWGGGETVTRLTGPDAATDPAGERHGNPRTPGVGGLATAALASPAPDSHGAGCEACSGRPGTGDARRLQPVVSGGPAWGQYEPAIRRWEQRLGRLAPPPTEAGPKGGQRLSPRFVEWMQGLPDGWVTDLPISRNDMLRGLGNGVVPQQAFEALRRLSLAEPLDGAA